MTRFELQMFELGFSFRPTTGGREVSMRPRQTKDCTVRMLACVTGLPYDVCYDVLALYGRRCSDGFNLRRWLLTQGWCRMTEDYSRSKSYVVLTADTRHCYAIVNGERRDSYFDRSEVGQVWEVDVARMVVEIVSALSTPIHKAARS